MTFLLIICIIIIIVLLSKNSSIKKEKDKKGKENITLNKELEKEKNDFSVYKESTEYLKKYEPIKNIEEELKRVSTEIEEKITKTTIEREEVIETSKSEANSIRKEAREKATETKNRAEIILENAHQIATKIENEANIKAESIAGEAWEAKNNAEQYQKTVKAMKNIIKGYGDEYLIPNHSLLDDLAEEYNHKKAGQELVQIRTIIKSMIEQNKVAECDYVESYRKTTAIEFVLDAFNGKVDTVMSKVKHDNYGKLLQSLKDAFRLVNHNGKAFKNARITNRYF